MDHKKTLQEGLKEFQKRNGQYFSDTVYSDAGNEFLKCHDIAHVVFGCDTTLYGEGLVKIWTSFGTTSSFMEITKGYREVQAYHLFSEYSVGHFRKHLLKLLGVIPKALIRTRKMSKPWPFKDYAQYLDQPIEEIRRIFFGDRIRKKSLKHRINNI